MKVLGLPDASRIKNYRLMAKYADTAVARAYWAKVVYRIENPQSEMPAKKAPRKRGLRAVKQMTPIEGVNKVDEILGKVFSHE